MEALLMLNNAYFPYQNFRPAQAGHGVFVVSRIEEAQSLLPDYGGNPSFFYNNVQNEIYVKQFDVKTGLVNLRRFVESKEPVKTQNNKLEEEINLLKKEIQRLSSKKEAEVNDAEL